MELSSEEIDSDEDTSSKENEKHAIDARNRAVIITFSILISICIDFRQEFNEASKYAERLPYERTRQLNLLCRDLPSLLNRSKRLRHTHFGAWQLLKHLKIGKWCLKRCKVLMRFERVHCHRNPFTSLSFINRCAPLLTFRYVLHRTRCVTRR